jgi:pimeloyl-ACP methyl ester carboxylesterase
VRPRRLATATVVMTGLSMALHLLEGAALRRWALEPDPRPDGRPWLAGEPDIQVVATDGARLRVARWGAPTGPCVVLVHGITASLEDWLPLVPHLLDAGVSVVALDLRGHGRSTLGSERVSTRRLADDLAEVLDVLDLRRVVLAGHSLGGYAALALAVHHPEVVQQRVARLVLVGSTPTMRGARELAALASNASPLTLVVQRHPRHGAVLMRAQVFGDRPSLPAIEDLRRRWSSCPFTTRVAYAKGLVRQTLTPRLSRVRVPVTVVRGSQDRVVPASRSQLLRTALPDGELVMLEGAGHATPTERPREVAAVLARAAVI